MAVARRRPAVTGRGHPLDARKHTADVGYNCYHVRLLRLLQAQAPGYGFGGWARRWDGYARVRGISCERDKATPQPGTVTG